MNFTNFWTDLQTLEKKIKITSPATIQVKAVYWGAPPQAISDTPAIINALTESDRVLGFGSRDQQLRINVQLLAVKATIDDKNASTIATALWFAAKDVFDADITINGEVSFSTLRGADPTVPVILSHAGQAYIGFNAYLDIQDVENFDFS